MSDENNKQDEPLADVHVERDIDPTTGFIRQSTTLPLAPAESGSDEEHADASTSKTWTNYVQEHPGRVWLSVLGSIASIVALLLVFWPSGSDDNPPPAPSTNGSSIEQEESDDTPIAEPITLGIHQIRPILDKGLFVGSDFGDVLFGGRNLNLLKLDIRSASGETIRWAVTNHKEHGPLISIELDVEPYIEFEYRGTCYALEFSEYITTASYTLSEIDEPTLQLSTVTVPSE